MNQQANRFLLGTIFFTVFLDLVGVGIAIPVTAPLLLNPLSGMLDLSITAHSRNIVYGFLIASFSIATFFGGPLLGSLSDKYGRKKLLLLSLFGTFTGYLIFIIGIYEKNIYLLFLSRIVDGFTGGNISIIQSAISDVSDEKNKAKNFGLIGMAFGLGFVIGPYIGGKLSDPGVVSWFSYETPFILAAILSLINMLLVVVNFKETNHVKSNKKLTIFTGFINIREAFSKTQWRWLFGAVFFYVLGFNFFTQFSSVYLIYKFKFTQGNIGDYLAFVGLCVALVQGFIVRRTAGKIASEKILRFTLIGLSLTLVATVLPDKLWLFLVCTPFMAFFQGMSAPNMTNIVSKAGDKTSQGKILGINQSFLSAGMAVPPILAAYLTNIDTRLPFIVAGLSVMLAWMLFMFYKNKYCRTE